MRVGQTARITTESFRDRVFEGRLTQISPIGVERDNVTTFEVEVSIDNADRVLKANMTANAEIVLESFPDSLIVPESAVTYDREKNAFVDRGRSGGRGRTPRRVPVTVGQGNGSRIRVLSGVDAGAKVVLPGLAGSPRLRGRRPYARHA